MKSNLSESEVWAECSLLAEEAGQLLERLAEIESRYSQLCETMSESTPAPAGDTRAERKEADQRRQEDWGLSLLCEALSGRLLLV